jgi:hypothetical protein
VKTIFILVGYPSSHADLGAPLMLSKLVKLLGSSNTEIAADVPQILFQLCVSEDPVSTSVMADSNIVRALVGIARQQVLRLDTLQYVVPTL